MKWKLYFPKQGPESDYKEWLCVVMGEWVEALGYNLKNMISNQLLQYNILEK